jgi:hypothetical protein
MYQLRIELGQAGLASIVEDEHGVDHCVAVVAVLDAPVALHAGVRGEVVHCGGPSGSCLDQHQELHRTSASTTPSIDKPIEQDSA